MAVGLARASTRVTVVALPVVESIAIGWFVRRIATESHRLRNCEEKAPPFTAGMNPTIETQPPVLSLVTAYRAVSTTDKNWWLDWGPPGRRRLPYRSRESVHKTQRVLCAHQKSKISGDVTEAVATRQAKSNPRPLVPAHRGTKGRQADGTARARTRGNL